MPSARSLVPRQLTGARLVFSAARGLEAELEDLIEKESACCPFFTFRLARTEETLTLDIGAPGGVEQLALELLGLPTQGR